MIVNRSKFTEGNNDSGYHEHLIGRCRRFFVVPAEPSEVVEPSENA